MSRYNRGPQYHRAEFDVKIIIGAADLKFQLWGKNGQLSKDHEEIEVLWDRLPSHQLAQERLPKMGMGCTTSVARGSHTDLGTTYNRSVVKGRIF